MSSKHASTDPNIFSRLHNAIMRALTKQELFAKLIVLVVDNDIIRNVKYTRHGASYVYGYTLDYFMKDLYKQFQVYKELLPAKCKCDTYPHLLWIEPPYNRSFHNNDLRYKFVKCLRTVGSYYEHTSVLQLKKIWDPNNRRLFHAETRRFTAQGLARYWDAIDNTVRYCDTLLNRTQFKKKKTPQWGNNIRNSARRSPAAAAGCTADLNLSVED